jgi:hypothetical protein
MSDISTLYDAVHSRIQTILPTHKRLSDPYLFTKNTDSEKRKGYGVRIGSGEKINPNQLSCDLILRQTMIVVLTRMVQGRETDSDKKAETEKQLLEDLFLIVKDFETEGMTSIPPAISADFISHNGIEFVGTGSDAIMKVETTFEFRYRENLN